VDGVISGEHGIGITKLEFLDAHERRSFRSYKQKADRTAASTRASCLAGGDCATPTPSFSLLAPSR